MPCNPKKVKAPMKAKFKMSGAGSSSIKQPPAKVWQLGVDGLEEDEQLQFDPTAYDCLHAFSPGWPLLSFDMLRYALGFVRNEFPHTLFYVAGTQADNAVNNSVAIADCQISLAPSGSR